MFPAKWDLSDLWKALESIVVLEFDEEQLKSELGSLG